METASRNDCLRYADNDSAAAIDAIGADNWDLLCTAAWLMDWEDPGVDCEIATTRETLDEIESSRQSFWKEKGRKTTGDLRGHSYTCYQRLQIGAGRRRQHLIVLDLGGQRVNLYADV